jgi:hypothetical protein
MQLFMVQYCTRVPGYGVSGCGAKNGIAEAPVAITER